MQSLGPGDPISPGEFGDRSPRVIFGGARRGEQFAVALARDRERALDTIATALDRLMRVGTRPDFGGPR